MQIDLHPDARAELRDAAIWYDDQQRGLGDAFVLEVQSVLIRLADAPASFPAWPGMSRKPPVIRRAILQRFPYVIAFEAHELRIWVLAIAHSKRRPLYWMDRSY